MASEPKTSAGPNGPLTGSERERAQARVGLETIDDNDIAVLAAFAVIFVIWLLPIQDRRRDLDRGLGAAVTAG